MSRVFSRYVHRATLGLPRQERLEAAAELRTHLMDRAARLEAEGFSREEAEHLAVKGMGDVGVTNRQLLGHVFTHRVAWVVLAVLVLGGGGWWVWQNVPLPMWGQATWRWAGALTTEDLSLLFTDRNAPRGEVLAADLSLPAQTRWLYVALVPRKDEGLAALSAADLTQRQPYSQSIHRSPNSRFKARALLAGQAWEDDICRPVPGQPQPQVALYTNLIPANAADRFLGGEFRPFCPHVKLPHTDSLRAFSSGWAKTDWTVNDKRSSEHRQARSLPMNQWTVVAFYGIGYQQEGEEGDRKQGVWRSDARNDHDFFYAVMPADHALHKERPEGSSPGVIVALDTTNWGKDAFGLPRPVLKQP